MQRQRWYSWVCCAAVALALIGVVFQSLPQGVMQASAQDASTPDAAASPAASPVPGASPIAESTVPEVPQVFASGRWRVTVVYAFRGPVQTDLALPAKDGRDWIVVVADVANWSGKRATFKPSGFGIRVAGVAKGSGFSGTQTVVATKQLGFGTIDTDKGVAIPSGKNQRLALVFRIDSSGGAPDLTYDNDALPLTGSLAQGGSITALPATEDLPALTEAKVTATPDGDTLTLDSGAAKLAGVDAPLGTDCFADQSTRRLERLAGDQVLVESGGDPSASYIWVQGSDGIRTLINESVIAAGSAAVTAELTGPYATWLNAADAAARAGLTGLWASCTNQHGIARDLKPATTDLVITSGGKDRAYADWVAWAPLLTTKPDGSAWAFFSAATTAGTDSGDKRLWLSNYDPKTGKWSKATPMAGGKVQMGPATVIDQNGLVNLVFTDRAEDKDGDFSTVMYSKEDGKGGWTKPIAVAAEPTSGYQLSPSLAIDKNDVIHVAWQDQRAFPAAARAASPSNADIFVSDLKPGGSWSKPVLISTHYTDGAASRPHIVADGDRLVAVWSVYATSFGLTAAIRVDWSVRTLDDELSWSAPDPLIVGRGESFGGRLLDMAADPTGGVVLVYGRQATDTFLFLRRLAPDSTTWGGDTLLTYGTHGTFPSVTVSDQGVVYVVYNAGTGTTVDVGAVAIPYRSIQPGPEVILTTDQPDTQGRAIITTDITGQPWIIYFSQPATGVANEVRVLRNAQIPTTAAASSN